MTIVNEQVFVESKSIRDNQISTLSHDKAHEILNKVKSLYFALWKGTETATTVQIADFYEVSAEVVQKVQQRHRGEFKSDGLQVIRGKALKDAVDSLSIPSATSQITIWTPRSALRLGMLLRDSVVAQTVRSSLLDMVEKVIPAQAQEIEKLKLELELAKTQERLMMTTQAIATMHGHEMVALVLGKPDAIVTRTENIETLVTVNSEGHAVAKYDGLGITFLARRYGFGKNTKECRGWLESIGIHDNQWLSEPSLVTAKKLPRELLPFLDKQYGTKQGVRQRLIGE